MNDTLSNLRLRVPQLWVNPVLAPVDSVLPHLPVQYDHMVDADNRLRRAGQLFTTLFPDAELDNGLIESPLLKVDSLKKVLGCSGNLYIKADDSLPVAGSVKARGGVYEVLLHAEQIALQAGLIAEGDALTGLASEACRRHFEDYTISVGSTGNLGLSIGIMASALGFACVVHMSADAKEWKKKRLRDHGVTVVEHAGDYASAVERGRLQSAADAKGIFIDDENSLPLFLGYSVAALRLKDQLTVAGIAVDKQNPLMVYIPCGVGGAPGGICFGLKHVFGDAVHCFFAEPLASPCMLLALASAQKEFSSVYDIGLDNKTDADGLAVAAASPLVSSLVRQLVSGIVTISDDDLYRHVYRLKITEGLEIEPSAAAGFNGPHFLLHSEQGNAYLRQCGIDHSATRMTHILWTTGGSFVPEEERRRFEARGKRLLTE